MDTSLPNPKKSSITPETKFEPSGYSYIVLCTNDDYSKPPVVYRGDRAIEHFFEGMAIEEEYINDILGEPEPLIIIDEAEQAFQLTTNCEVCQTLFDENVIKVRDHAHHGITRDPRKKDYTNYRLALCQRCNLSLKEPSYIPVLFHNSKNFDTHLLLQKADCFKDKPISCIPNNMEKYVSLTIGNLRFLDTCQFLNSSLDTLVNKISQEGSTHVRQFKKAFPSEDIAKFLLRKNEYCYDYVDCEERFQERQLPSKEAFHNRLTDDPFRIRIIITLLKF
ncbi:Hypothetical predicted protein [Mytilus galloprovincialis]|uniref:DNA-directed DNA polymerase n=1 Tax=Mytilus galloprovincialis TaxID=29158 RepID=A0A8B6EFX2_MYTGA|nr:Hypothetical predicted protein [Mytilus galloprovincialis]